MYTAADSFRKPSRAVTSCAQVCAWLQKQAQGRDRGRITTMSLLFNARAPSLPAKRMFTEHTLTPRMRRTIPGLPMAHKQMCRAGNRNFNLT